MVADELEKKVKVRILGSQMVREVTLEEARKILEEVYEDPGGGMVADPRTGEAISQLGPDTDEILIIGQMMGGG